MLDKHKVLQDVARALAEDVGQGDITAGLIPEATQGHANIISREPMVVCGKPWVDGVFQSVDKTLDITWHVKEGDVLTQEQTLLSIRGAVRSMLTAERTALNFLQTLSGVATETKRYVSCLEGTKTQLLDTRKTLPGLRYAEKYAVTIGGGVNHRMGLYDAVLIKENHIKACGSIAAAVDTAKTHALGQWIEVEVETLDELAAALQAKPDRILLDNFNTEALRQAVALRGEQAVLLEASGGVTLEGLRALAETGVDYISVGAVTKSVRAIDLSLLLEDAT